ncbi:hypothetical protein GCM10010332_74090 [Streptomyces albogriseolus]|nr:hypothetical protein GCM10010332_74090 [Streptomyces albogriseolus]
MKREEILPLDTTNRQHDQQASPVCGRDEDWFTDKQHQQKAEHITMGVVSD